MTKVSILFDEKHISDMFFECMYFGCDNVYIHLLKHLKDIRKKPFLVFAMNVHNGIAIGMFGIYAYLRGFNRCFWDNFCKGRMKGIMNNLFYKTYLFFSDLLCKIYFKILESIKKFTNIHIDHIKSGEFTQE